MPIMTKNVGEIVYSLQTGSGGVCALLVADDNVAVTRVLKAGTIISVHGACSIGTSVVLELERVKTATQASVGTVTATPTGVAMSSLSNTQVEEGDKLVMHVGTVTGAVAAELSVVVSSVKPR